MKAMPFLIVLQTNSRTIISFPRCNVHFGRLGFSVLCFEGLHAFLLTGRRALTCFMMMSHIYEPTRRLGMSSSM